MNSYTLKTTRRYGSSSSASQVLKTPEIEILYSVAFDQLDRVLLWIMKRGLMGEMGESQPYT